MRKHGSILASTVSVIGALIIGVGAMSAHAEPRSFPLVCKGGPNQRVEVNFNRLAPGQTEVIIRFKGAPSSATSRPVNPGECGWIDRGWRKGEPEILLWSGTISGFKILFEGGRAKVLGSTLRQVSPANRDSKFLINAISGEEQFQVYAYREDSASAGEPVLRVTRIGP